VQFLGAINEQFSPGVDMRRAVTNYLSMNEASIDSEKLAGSYKAVIVLIGLQLFLAQLPYYLYS
jgi:hypothetical protein